MKLRKQQIDVIASKLVDELVQRGSIEVEDEPRAKTMLRKVITDDLMVEDQLNDEARDMLTKIGSNLQHGSLEYHKMFKLVKEKLAKERNLIL